MSAPMHRIQISLTEGQTEFLAEQARRNRVSRAEVVRQLIQREATVVVEPRKDAASLWEIASIAEDHGPLIDDIPVSEQPEKYLTGVPSSSTRGRR